MGGLHTRWVGPAAVTCLWHFLFHCLSCGECESLTSSWASLHAAGLQAPTATPSYTNSGTQRRARAHTHTQLCMMRACMYTCIYIYGGCSKVLSFFPGLSQDLREAFASFRAWGFTTVGENGFSLGLEAFKDSCSCPGTSCVLWSLTHWLLRNRKPANQAVFMLVCFWLGTTLHEQETAQSGQFAQTSNLLFPGPGKSKRFRLRICFFPTREKAKWFRLPICFFPGREKAKRPDFQFAFSREKAKWFRLRICFFPSREKAKWFRLPFCFFPAREKAKWSRLPICFFPAREKAKCIKLAVWNPAWK